MCNEMLAPGKMPYQNVLVNRIRIVCHPKNTKIYLLCPKIVSSIVSNDIDDIYARFKLGIHTTLNFTIWVFN